MRADAAERETARLADENRTLHVELEAAKLWLGGPKRRMLVLATVIAISAAFGVAGIMIGRTTATSLPCPVVPKAAPVAGISGVMVADGPMVGHWTLTTTRCAVRSDGIELSAIGNSDHIIWLGEHSVEIEVPNNDFFLDAGRCTQAYDRALVKHDDGYSGQLTLDCAWFGSRMDGRLNRLQGHIEFTGCK